MQERDEKTNKLTNTALGIKSFKSEELTKCNNKGETFDSGIKNHSGTQIVNREKNAKKSFLFT